MLHWKFTISALNINTLSLVNRDFYANYLLQNVNLYDRF